MLYINGNPVTLTVEENGRCTLEATEAGMTLILNAAHLGFTMFGSPAAMDDSETCEALIEEIGY